MDSAKPATKKPPVGLLLSLEPKPDYTETTSTEGLNKLGVAIGYFDYVRFSPVQEWFDFCPDHLDLGHESKNYFLKLCFPTKDVREKLEAKGFSYDCWMKNHSDLFQEKPCVSVVLVNLTDTFKYSSTDRKKDPFTELLEELADALTKACEACDEATPPEAMLRQASCCILPSLGYSDYGILFAEETWNIALQVMSELHQAPDTDNRPILSADYSIPVYFQNDVPASPSRFRSDVHLASRLTLKPGYTVLDVVNYLSSRHIRIHAYEINDMADCLLVSDAGTAGSNDLLRELVDIRKAPPASPSLAKMVTSSKSRLHRKTPNSNLEPTTPARNLPKDLSPKFICDLSTALKAFRKMLKDNGRNLRRANALLETASTLEAICKQPHSQSLRTALEPVLEAFTACIKDFTAAAKNATSAQWQGLEDTLDIFRSRIGGYVTDLTRSDCFAMESEQYNHPAVSSATFLLLGLNRIINELVREVQEPFDHSESKHGFLLTSGGCDQTITHKMFDFLVADVYDENGQPKESLPFVMQVAEVGLFDCSSTMLRLVHEVMHHCGDRKRSLRVELMRKFFCIQLGQYLANASLDVLKEKSLKDMLHAIGENHELEEACEQDFPEVRNRLAQPLAKYLDARLEAMWNIDICDPKKNPAALKMSCKYIKWLSMAAKQVLDHIVDALNPSKPEKENPQLAQEILDIFFEARRNLWEAWASKWNSRLDTAYSPCDLKAAKTQSWLDRLASGDTGIFNELSFSRRELGELLLGYQTELPRTVSNTFAIFSESFSDAAAKSILGSNWVDYLLCFLLESNNVDQTLPDSVENCFRIPLVLRKVYGFQGYLAEKKNRKHLNAALAALAQNGFRRSRRAEKALTERVDSFLAFYDSAEYAPYCGILERYLMECEECLESGFNPKRYHDKFAQLRGLRVKKDSDDDRDYVITMLQAMTDPAPKTSSPQGEEGKGPCAPTPAVP